MNTIEVAILVLLVDTIGSFYVYGIFRMTRRGRPANRLLLPVENTLLIAPGAQRNKPGGWSILSPSLSLV